MLINISDVDGKTKKRTLTVTDGDTVLFTQAVADTKEGQKLANLGLKHGWDSDKLK